MAALLSLGAVGCAELGRPSITVAPPPAGAAPALVAVVFMDPAGTVARRLASECLRRRAGVLTNTPESVVCKHIPIGSRELVAQPSAEIWSFVLTQLGDGTTRVEGRRSFDAVSDAGYAVLSFDDADTNGADPIRSFMDEVQALDGLRGKLSP